MKVYFVLGKDSAFAFMDPSQISTQVGKRDMRAAFIIHGMEIMIQGQILFATWNTE